MSRDNKRNIEKRRLELLRHIRTCEYNRERIIKHSRLLDYSYDKDLINYKEYKESKIIEGKTPEWWIKYYDEQIKSYNKILDNYNVSESKINPLLVLGLLLVILVSSLVIVNYKEGITGLVVQETSGVANETLLENEKAKEINETLPVELDNVDATPPIAEEFNETVPVIEPIVETNASIPFIEEVIQGKAEINKPVKWKKIVKLEKKTDNLEVEIPGVSKNINVIKKENGESIDLDENNLKIERDGETLEAVNTDLISGGTVFNVDNSNWLKSLIEWIKAGSITGKAVAENIDTSSNMTLIIEEPVEEIEVEYETPGPKADEIEVNDYTKEIVVYSDIHYENITAYTDIKEGDLSSVKIYRTTKGIRELTEIIYNDLDENGLIDNVEWIVPSLSNQTYEISITILNVQSYPTVEGNWTVAFNTTGIANLTITVANVTTWSNVNEENDLKFLEIKCGEQLLQYQWINDSVFVENYSCNDLGFETSKVLTEGVHDLMFGFGDLETWAHNLAIRISDTAGDVDIAALNNETFVIVWHNGTSTSGTNRNSSQFVVMNTNGTKVLGPVTLSNGILKGNTRVAVTPINETAFILGWTSGVLANDSMLKYDISAGGKVLMAETCGDCEIGSQFYDIGLANMGTTFAYCLIDATELDADLRIYNTFNNSLVNIETDVDTGAGPATNSTNVVDCAAIDSTSTIFFYYDVSVTDATFYASTNVATQLIAATDIDAAAAGAQVATTGINNDQFVLLWWNGTSVNFALRYKNNTIIRPPRRIEHVGITAPRIDVAPINNGSQRDSRDGFVAVWMNASRLMGAVFDQFGNISNPSKQPFVIDNNVHQTFKLISVAGRNPVSGNSLCTGTFVVAYTNSSNSLLTRTFWHNGSEWNGNCPSPPITPYLHSPDDKAMNPTNMLTVQFNWSNSTDDDGDSITYYLEIWNDSAATQFTFANASIIGRINTTTANYTFPSETNDYFWRVLANDKDGNSTWTPLRNISILQVIPNTAPTTPVLHKPNDTDNNPLNVRTVQFNWSNSSDVNGDQIYYYLEIWNNSATTQFTFANASIKEIQNTTTANYTFPNETNDYFWRVLATDGSLNSSFTGLRNISIQINRYPTTPVLHKPDNLNISELNMLTSAFNWSNSSDPDGDQITYYLEVWNDSAATQFMFRNASITERGNTTTANITFPNQTGDYFWRVRAFDGRLNSSFTGLRNYSVLVNRYPTTPVLHKPDNLNISELNMLTSAFNWSNSSDPDGDPITYYLEVWNDSAATQFMFRNASIQERRNTTSANVTFPNQTGDYFWRVRAFDGVLNSSWTGLRNYSVLVNRYPTTPQLNAPLNNTIMPVNRLVINLNWSNSSDPDGDQINYYLEIWNDSATTQFMYANASVRETANVTVANVTFPNQTGDYFWRVLATDGRLNSSWSDLWNVTINVTSAVGNAIPQITFVSGVPSVIGTESGVTYTEISFIVNDSDGSSNLNDTSGQVRFMNTSVPITRINYTCAKVNNPTPTSGNYTCRVDLWYFDAPGNYTINVTFGDINGARTENSSTQLEFQQLTSVKISPISFTWSSLNVLSTNVSSETAVNISNTGNKNIANGSVTLTAIDLSGEITKIERIFVGNISVTHLTGAGLFQCSNNNATLLFNNTAKPIRPNGTLPRGNNTLNLGTLNATICLQSVNNSITAQKYSTNGSGKGQEWTVTVS